ncbi:MAG: hypothetical protein LBC99_05890 [Spirochaetota bacterium]|jgi:hypothetical protein|nr:hypothetical protein [Spirochaetota bacterium]
MKITAIHSKSSGSTHAIAMLLDEIQRIKPDTSVSEFTAADFPSCIGCCACFVPALRARTSDDLFH